MFTSKITTVLAMLVAVFGALAAPELLAILPAKWAAIIAAGGAIVAGLSRALVDADGDGVPDAFQRRGTGF